MEPRFVVVYDILNEGIGAKRFWHLAAWLIGLALGGFMFWWVRRKPGAGVVIMTVWLTLWTCIGGIATGNGFYQRLRCLAWARAGNVEVIEGRVEDFDPMPSYGHASESFRVGRTKFTYSDYDESTGAFNNAASLGGPIHEGMSVRISHHAGRILKIEVRR